jgi:UDP-GlcNAc:undecaprenyl-phosphate GlcNAc-1-phosphate transferase
MQFIVFLISVLSSAVLTRWVRDLAIRNNWVFAPTSSRHLHTRPIPRFGGLAILLTLWEMVLLARWLPGHMGMAAVLSSRVAVGILGPATLIFLLGLWDDIRGLSAYTKFAVQIVAAILLYMNGFGISLLSVKIGGASVSWMVGLPLTIVWVLWITNAFNLIDGLDGLAAGSALFSTLVICIVAVLGHNDNILFLTLALAGAIAGFLRYNFNPASIFLGDCGSLLIGFLLSAIALAGSQKSPTMVAVAIPIVSLGLPILDVTISVLRRFLGRKKLFSADSEHIHHKLISRGVPHKQAVLLLYGVSACFALLSLFLLNPGSRTVGMVLAVLGTGVLVGVQQLRYHEFFELKQEASRTLNLRQVIANNVHIRRAVEELETCDASPDLCAILQKCLEPIGFNGFSASLLVDLAPDVECFPFRHSAGSNLHFSWDPGVAELETNWSVTFPMARKNGQVVGTFTLYRRSTLAPLWMDLNVFTATGFSPALAHAFENIQDRWLIARRKTAQRANTQLLVIENSLVRSPK